MIRILFWMMIIMKLKFINSSKDENEKNEKIVKMTVTKMIFKFKKLLINVKMLLTLMNEMIIKMKWDWWCLSCWNFLLMLKNT